MALERVKSIMKRMFRFRNIVVVGGTLCSLLFLVATQPNLGLIKQLPYGGETAQWLGDVSRFFVALLLLWLGRKALHDYPAADVEKMLQNANLTPEGSGRALQFIGLVCVALAMLLAPLVSRAQGYPKAADKLLPTLATEIATNWPDHPMPHYFGGLLDHESCPSPTHSYCWSTTARLKTHREEGCGPMQVTRAWHPSGALRFDTLDDLRRRHAGLAEWSWDNCYTRGDLQMRAVVLFSRDLWEQFPGITSDDERLAFVDVSYNQGPGRTRADRRACSLTAGCNPQLYWGHVEQTCTASKAALYGRRSPCDISRHHAVDVVTKRAPKYMVALAR